MRVQAGTYTALAIEAERNAQRTMYGFDEAKGKLQEALSVIPKRHKQIAENIVMNGTKREKRQFYSLLPDEEKRVLGKFLGVSLDQLPDKPRLAQYFSQHYLPDTDWLGWEKTTDLEDIKIRAADLENVKIDKPGRARLNKAKAYTKGIRVPNMHSKSGGNVRRELDRLIATGKLGNVRVDYKMVPSSKNSVTVNTAYVDTDQSKYQNELQKALKY